MKPILNTNATVIINGYYVGRKDQKSGILRGGPLRVMCVDDIKGYVYYNYIKDEGMHNPYLRTTEEFVSLVDYIGREYTE